MVWAWLERGPVYVGQFLKHVTMTNIDVLTGANLLPTQLRRQTTRLSIIHTILYSREMSVIHLIKTYCLPTMLYGCEVWTLSDSSVFTVLVWGRSERGRNRAVKTNRLVCLFVCSVGWLEFNVPLRIIRDEFVRHAFERQRLCARFRHEVGVQKRFWCRWIGEGL